jgi:hypothetical protein
MGLPAFPSKPVAAVDNSTRYNVGDDGGGGMNQFVTDIMRVDSAQGLLSENGAVETEREAVNTIANEISERAKEVQTPVDAGATASASADLNTLAGDVSSPLNPDTPLGELASLFDPNAVTDITSLLSADLAPNASGSLVDLLSLF